MVVLVAWKPIALVIGLLSALTVVSYFGSALTREILPPSAPGTGTRRSRNLHNHLNWYAQAVFRALA
jgi:hypothetical protein